MLLHDLILREADERPEAIALIHSDREFTYGELGDQLQAVAHGLVSAALEPGQRIAVWLDKGPELVVAAFGATLAGAVFVPINPIATVRQVQHILNNSGARVLVTNPSRLQALHPLSSDCHHLKTVILTATELGRRPLPTKLTFLYWNELLSSLREQALPKRIDEDVAAIFYTSGSTGLAKGVILSHRNLIVGARSVSEYLGHSSDDILLAALPLSFDAGFSQLTTAFNVGARAVLHRYLVPSDVPEAIARHKVTGLLGVPSLWSQLARVTWPKTAADGIRYIANTGGVLPQTILRQLRQKAPNANVFLMYGLTEAFRSTYLPPSEVHRRPSSIGKAIPNTEILVVRPNGEQCAPGEPGELIHRGALVSLGYWNDPEATARRFRPTPNQAAELPLPEIAVWSGDTVVADEDGFLYFVGRKDHMIKSSGYRISPTEIEEVIHEVDSVLECIALGVPHPDLGEAVIAVCRLDESWEGYRERILGFCAASLPGYMVPKAVFVRTELPRTPNGKIDRNQLVREYTDLFVGTAD